MFTNLYSYPSQYNFMIITITVKVLFVVCRLPEVSSKFYINLIIYSFNWIRNIEQKRIRQWLPLCSGSRKRETPTSPVICSTSSCREKKPNYVVDPQYLVWIKAVAIFASGRGPSAAYGRCDDITQRTTSSVSVCLYGSIPCVAYARSSA